MRKNIHALQNFYETEVILLSERCLEQQQNKIKDYSIEFKNSLMNHFVSACRQIRKVQKENLLGELNAIYFVQLNINVLHKKFEYPVLAFDTDLFSREYNEMACLKTDGFYEKLIEFWETLEIESKKYSEHISVSDIENIVLEESQKYHSIARNFMKQMGADFTALDEWKEISLQRTFHLFVGGLYDYPYEIIEIRNETVI